MAYAESVCGEYVMWMTRTRGNLSDAEIEQIVGEYETWLSSWSAARTTKARVSLARSRLKEWRSIEAFTPENIAEFLGRPTSRGKPKSKWSKATYHGNLTDFCKWLVATDRLDESPMTEVRSVRRPKSRPNPLSDRDVQRVLDAVRGRTRDWILLALRAGLRVSEIASIRGENVHVDGIRVVGKGGDEQQLPCHPDIWAMAQQYPRVGYWFPNDDGGHIESQAISMTVGRLFHALGISGSIHRCRHTYATSLLRSGVHIRQVQRLMRHANLETTAAYTAVDEDLLNAAVNMLPDFTPPPAA